METPAPRPSSRWRTNGAAGQHHRHHRPRRAPTDSAAGRHRAGQTTRNKRSLLAASPFRATFEGGSCASSRSPGRGYRGGEYIPLREGQVRRRGSSWCSGGRCASPQRRMYLTTLGAGDHLGELALCCDAPRGMTPTSDGQSEQCSRHDFFDLLRSEPELSGQVADVLGHRGRDR